MIIDKKLKASQTSVPYEPDLVYDVGAHCGEDTEFYLKKGFRVVAIEANPALQHFLHQKFRTEIRSRQLVLVDCAIAKTEGVVEFFVNEKMSVWGTIDAAWAVRNQNLGAPSHRVVVKATRFENILCSHGIPYYLKIDIEGADMLCVEALHAVGGAPKFLSIESDKLHWEALVREFDVMEALGYSKFKVINQRRITRQSPPQPAREGRYALHRFAPGSSGLFGSELPGEWLSRKEALAKYRRIFWHYRLLGTSTLAGRVADKIAGNLLTPPWYDTHASV